MRLPPDSIKNINEKTPLIKPKKKINLSKVFYGLKKLKKQLRKKY
tara:strand:+ start:581 stop:715 length:135 start_codon:yes stop_codon:yes gene_type:complete